MRRLLVASSLVMIPLCSPIAVQSAMAMSTSTSSDVGYIQLDGLSAKNVLIESGDNMIPGDKQGQTVTIRNNGPSSGIVHAYLVDPKVVGTGSNVLRSDLRTEWDGALGKGSSSFTSLGFKRDLGNIALRKGETTNLYVGVSYPATATNVPARTASSVAEASFNLRLEMVEAYPSSKLSVSIRPVVSESPVVLGTSIFWEIVVRNDGSVPLTDLDALSTYLSSLGTDAYCPQGALEPGASATCTVRTTVTAADVQRGYVELDAQVSAAFPDGSLILSEPATARVAVSVPTETPKPSPSPTDGPTATPVPTDTPTTVPNPDSPTPTPVNNPTNNVPLPVGNEPNNPSPGSTLVPPSSTKNPAPSNPIVGAVIKSGELVVQHPFVSTAGVLLLSVGVALLIAAKRRKHLQHDSDM